MAVTTMAIVPTTTGVGKAVLVEERPRGCYHIEITDENPIKAFSFPLPIWAPCGSGLLVPSRLHRLHPGHPLAHQGGGRRRPGAGGAPFPDPGRASSGGGERPAGRLRLWPELPGRVPVATGG